MTYTEWSELTTEEKLNFINTKLANRDVEPINTKKKTLHISHNDLDGVGCVAVAMMLGIYPQKVQYEFVPVNDADESILREMVEFTDNGEVIFVSDIIISDISVKNRDVADMLDTFNNVVGTVTLIDHHPTASWLNDYKWAEVITGKDSATYLLADYFWTHGLSKYGNIDEDRPDNIFEYARIVSRYDTWEWKNTPLDLTEENHSIILNAIGTDGYLAFVTDELAKRNTFKICTFDPNPIITAILHEYSNTIEKETERAIKNISKFMLGYIRAAIIKYDGKTSLSVVANNVIEHSHGTDEDDIQVLFILCGDNTLSLRKNKRFDAIELGTLAQQLAFDPRYGGGHPDAAGCKLSYDAFIELLRIYYLKSDDYKKLQYRIVTPDSNVVDFLGGIKFNNEVAWLNHAVD